MTQDTKALARRRSFLGVVIHYCDELAVPLRHWAMDSIGDLMEPMTLFRGTYGLAQSYEDFCPEPGPAGSTPSSVPNLIASSVHSTAIEYIVF